ncbi:lysylphosphatidylglycerol synthase transmembrane domain-containing protein [Leuconostoc gasicomitatum]|uniref:lysylphosphatidylglycerol synthase transmembrane domain-containing protein n=1 Tax=Leuconostoc gasicomitatum TaxID=115778 RepID=UPI0007DE5EDA|nr:lysylphosphatidylglycerol synthase transmembrane domain-containing protein [Leuconostoc gasicomitatum]MBR2277054.1 flippase-like domain-containing protein [Leuconostoc sp.]MBZ5946996.1 flippase-like domain-containing protein [Leuconostoc gasicomitatum]MBZ5954087.1 flippase-like domain-containing protein [Leuconostoc gasicomitatum]MBZ5955877.1 flippase-like domain-containing protein [Leuconostoc gasicomitatum]MBZ5983704.1 flippase-like domain-containing protein [Leuconostoc gasicomitatum]
MSKIDKISTIIVVVLTAVVVYFLTNELHGKSKQLAAALKHLDWRWLFFGLLMMILSIFLEAAATYAMLNKADRRQTSILSLLRVPLLNLLGTGVTPFATGGQPAQLFGMTRAGIESGRALSVILMKFLVYQVVVVMFFIIAYFSAEHFIYAQVDPTFAQFIPFAIAIHAFVILGIALVMFWPAMTLRLVDIISPLTKKMMSSERHDRLITRIKQKIHTFHEESRRVISSWESLVGASIFTILQLVVFYMIPYFVIRAFGYENVNPWLIVTMNIMIVMVISLFPIPGGVGGAELSFQLLFSPFVNNPATMILVILLWRLITYYFGLFAGIITYMLPAKKIKEGR